MPGTILVTGSLGYLGSRLTRSLADAGRHVRGIDTGFFRDCALYPPQDPDTILKDMRDIEANDLDGISAVVHLAGMSNDPFGSLTAEEVYDPTRRYTKRLAELCKARGIRFLFASSCSVYGIGGKDPVTEGSPTFPQTPYSRNKLEIEQDLVAMTDGTFAPIILRFATAFGLSPRMRFDVVVNMLVGMAVTTRQIILNSDGQAWRPHVHIDDVCLAIRRCLELDPWPRAPLIVNVGETAANVQVLDVARMVQAEVPGSEIVFLNQVSGGRADPALDLIRDRKIQDGVDPRTYRVSFERITQVLPGFRCDWTVARGIERLVRELVALPLTAAQFRDPRFYRLQRLESLLGQGMLSAELFWAAAASR